jgi:aldehyde:ferredoxin oxidoreductase
MEESVPNGPAEGHAISASMLDAMLDDYYALRGWDNLGIPKTETLARLNLLGEAELA